MKPVILAVLALATLAAAPTTSDRKPIGPLPPDRARGALELEPGLEADLVAAEPLVKSPCAVCWDERGRMFVAENIGYPLGGPNGEAVGDVVMLEDTDGDGIPDKRTVFAEHLTFPNGVMPWRGGLIVTCAPDVLYFKDSKGDGHADVKEVLLTGFSTNGSTQLRVNAPTLGPDGWVYLAGGLTGGMVHSPKHPERVLDSRKGDVKFKPDTGEIELVDGKGQYGLTFNDVGDRLVCMNRIQVQHAPLPARYLARNPAVRAPGVLQACPDLILNTLLVHSSNAGSKVFPISANITTADSHAGTYTAACAVHVAKGDSLPPAYRNVAWSCEPTGNLARCDELVPTGGTFHAVRMHEGTEAFRSRDDWSRPVFLADGPDGALWVCDMYRRIIEHPEYLPDEIRKNGDFTQGKQMGRVWRVFAAELKRGDLAGRERARLDAFAAAADAPEKLVPLLKSTDGWTRDTAFRLITERGTPVAALKAVLAGSLPPEPRIACLRLLDNAGKLDDADVATALADATPAVREVGVRLAEPRLGKSTELAAKVLALADDADLHVRYAVALAAGYAGDGEAVVKAMAKLAQRDSDDKWFRAAILTSVPQKAEEWALLESLATEPLKGPGEEDFLRDLSRTMNDASAGAPSAGDNLGRMLQLSAHGGYATQAALLLGLADRDQLDEAAKTSVHGSDDLRRVLTEAQRVGTDPKATIDQRTKAITLLGATDVVPSAAATLKSLISSEQPQEVAAAAARAIAQPRHVDALAEVLSAARWQKYPPTLRAAVLSSIIGHPALAKPLLDAIESGAVPAGMLMPNQKEWLQKLKDDQQRARAEKLFAGGGLAKDRMKVYEETKAQVMALTGHAPHGQKVFRDNCTTCHRLDREGVAVGPDLLDIRSLDKQTILLHIVIPEYEIAPNFTLYNCVTKDGRTISGIMIAETPAAVTLREPLAVEETIQRDQIQSIEASKLSLMPQGLEKVIPPQDMADLLAYLRGEK